MGKLLREKNLRDVWCRNEIVRAEIGQIVHTHTRVSYSSIDYLTGPQSDAFRVMSLERNASGAGKDWVPGPGQGQEL